MTIYNIPRLDKVYWGCSVCLDFTLGALRICSIVCLGSAAALGFSNEQIGVGIGVDVGVDVDVGVGVDVAGAAGAGAGLVGSVSVNHL